MNRLKNRKKILYFLIAFLVTCLFTNFAKADIIKLDDGTILDGKILKKDKNKIIIKNYYGTFTIKKRQITKLYITEDYNEDIEILQQLGFKTDKERIKKNYFAGLQNIQKDSFPLWNARISLLGAYLVTTGKLKDAIPYGSTYIIAFDGLNFTPWSKKYFWFPDIRFETGYLHYVKNPAKVTGYTTSGGPIWFISIIKKKWGKFVISVLPGMSFLKIENDAMKATSNTFSLGSLLGYEYSIGDVSFFLQVRNMSISDKNANLNSIGGSFGIGYAIW